MLFGKHGCKKGVSPMTESPAERRPGAATRRPRGARATRPSPSPSPSRRRRASCARPTRAVGVGGTRPPRRSRRRQAPARRGEAEARGARKSRATASLDSFFFQSRASPRPSRRGGEARARAGRSRSMGGCDAWWSPRAARARPRRFCASRPDPTLGDARPSWHEEPLSAQLLPRRGASRVAAR